MGVTVENITSVFDEVRDLLKTSETSGNAVFTDWDPENDVAYAGEYDADQYETYGPKNEVYLDKGQAITFKVEGEGNVSVGLKSLTGAELEVHVTNADEKAAYPVVAHSTDLYYAVKADANNLVTVMNNGDGILALTKIQLVSTTDTAMALSTVDAEEAAAYVTRFAAMSVSENEVEVVNPAIPEVDVDVEIENPQPEVQPDPLATLRDLVKKLFNQIFVWF
jgi:hypothetical protein